MIGRIWFAGGCFWGTEKLFQSVRGVTSTEVGYANGDPDTVPTYESVCRRIGGYRETVRVSYDTEKVSPDFLIYTFFYSIDPALENRQGNDYGPQYQACIFWNDPQTELTVRRISDTEKRRCGTFRVVLEPLGIFVPAEEYHQKYLDRNENGYCHIDRVLFGMAADRKFDPGDYVRPSDREIERMLDPVEYEVTQNHKTEIPFENRYWDFFEDGIYVDRVTGEPLFLSSDKYRSGSGWPAFSRAIDHLSIIFLDDDGYGLRRIAINSRVGNTHLGHVFFGEEDSPTGVRFCINSASLRFVPPELMEKKGYGQFVRQIRGSD